MLFVDAFVFVIVLDIAIWVLGTSFYMNPDGGLSCDFLLLVPHGRSLTAWYSGKERSWNIRNICWMNVVSRFVVFSSLRTELSWCVANTIVMNRAHCLLHFSEPQHTNVMRIYFIFATLWKYLYQQLHSHQRKLLKSAITLIFPPTANHKHSLNLLLIQPRFLKLFPWPKSTYPSSNQPHIFLVPTLSIE